MEAYARAINCTGLGKSPTPRLHELGPAARRRDHATCRNRTFAELCTTLIITPFQSLAIHAYNIRFSLLYLLIQCKLCRFVMAPWTDADAEDVTQFKQAKVTRVCKQVKYANRLRFDDLRCLPEVQSIGVN